MSDTVTRVTNRNYFQRVGSSFKGILFGLLLILGAFIVLWRNEGNFVSVAKSLDEGRGAVVEVQNAEVLADNEGELIHSTAPVNANGNIGDGTFNVTREALQLNRTVEMYQWQESSTSTTTESIGGGEETTTTYSYATDWSSAAIDSGTFAEPAGHQNPGSIPYENQTITSETATWGGFNLEENIIDRIGGATPVGLNNVDVSGVENAKTSGNFIFIGDDPSSPQVGDVRVSFTEILPGTISVVAEQAGNRLIDYEAKSGSEVLLVSTGEQTPDEMFTDAEEANAFFTWVLRGVGFLMMWFGLNMVFAPLSTVFAVIPFMRRFVGGAVSIATFIIALMFSTITIALAWLFYRPLLSIILLAITGGIVYLVKTQIFDKKDASKPAES